MVIGGHHFKPALAKIRLCSAPAIWMRNSVAPLFLRSHASPGMRGCGSPVVAGGPAHQLPFEQEYESAGAAPGKAGMGATEGLSVIEVLQQVRRYAAWRPAAVSSPPPAGLPREGKSSNFSAANRRGVPAARRTRKQIAHTG